MSILENAKEHFRARMSADLHSVEVPEWTNGADTPERIYFKPSMSLRDQGLILQLSQDGKTAEALAQTLILRGLNIDGKRIWGQAAMTEFMRLVDPDVIARVVNAISGDDDESDEELEKN